MTESGHDKVTCHNKDTVIIVKDAMTEYDQDKVTRRDDTSIR